MKKIVFMDKYPIYSLGILKSEIRLSKMEEIVAFFKAKIEAHPIARFIAVFDHYAHTKSLNGDMVEGLLDAKNVIFCFGSNIPNTKVVAVRPRSIAICEMQDSFIIEFLEAPKEELHVMMEQWTKELVSEA